MMYAIDFWWGLWFLGGLGGMISLVATPVVRKRKVPLVRVELFFQALVFSGSFLLSGVGFGYARDRSCFEARLWLDLAVFTAAFSLLLLGEGVMFLALLSPFVVWLRPFQIGINVRSNAVYVDEGLDFPKFQCHVKEIIGVQVLGRGSQSSASNSNSGFQVNLILDRANKPRISLCEYTTSDPAQDVGRSLAEFLKVSLVEQISVAA